MDLVKALERYIDQNKFKDPEIAIKIRPALNCIRFWALDSKDIVTTSLLTPEEIVGVIMSLPPQGERTKLPKGFSPRTMSRQKNSTQKMSRIRYLNEVYSSLQCFSCSSKRLVSDHAIWTCPDIGTLPKSILKSIYQKYNHVSVIEYTQRDMETVFAFYKEFVCFNYHTLS